MLYLCCKLYNFLSSCLKDSEYHGFKDDFNLLFCYQLVDNKTNQYNQNLPRSVSLGLISTLDEYCHSLSGSIKHQVSVVQSTKDKDH